jgi:hypothetical protein
MNMKFAALPRSARCRSRLRAAGAAADNGFYLGAGVTQTEVRLGRSAAISSTTTASSSSRDSARSTGWRSKPTTSTRQADGSRHARSTNAITVSALCIAEFAVVDLYARVGMAQLELDARADRAARMTAGNPPTASAVGAHFGSVGVRAEYETFKRRR